METGLPSAQRWAVATLVLAIAASTGDDTSGQVRVRPAASAAAIAGIAVDADSGTPLRHAVIGIASSDRRSSNAVPTDDEGRFELAEVPPGIYSVTATKTGYLPATAGQRRYFDAGQPVDVREGQTSRVVVYMWRASAIDGRLVDEFGEPLMNARVRALRYTQVAGRLRLAAAADATTDDIGEFRLFGLLPGRYYVEALPTPVGPVASGQRESALAPTYYPATADIGAAETLRLGVGETASIQIASVRTPLHRIRGTATDASGVPIRGRPITVDRLVGALSTPSNSATTSPDGTFTLTDLQPGRYLLRMNEMVNQQSESLLEVITLDDDIDTLSIQAQRSVRVTGRIVTDTRPAPPSTTLAVVAVHPGVADDLRIPGLGSVVRDDLTFELVSRPGASLLRVNGLPSGWAMESVLVAGRDVTDAGIELRPGQNLSGVEIRLTSRVTDLGGTVVDSRQQPVAGATVILFAADRARWGARSRYIMTQISLPSGAFRFRGLPPGRYLAVALEEMGADAAVDPTLLTAVVANATPVTIANGINEPIELGVRPGAY